MCGFLVCLGPANVLPERVKFTNALNLQQHRGPDDSQVISIDKDLMGLRRLSILDINPRHNQPIDTIEHFKKDRKSCLNAGFWFGVFLVSRWHAIYFPKPKTFELK